MKAFAATLTTIALAAASLSAQAQSSVQLTGTIDSYAGSVKLAGQERVASVGSGGMTTSWWGIKGTEDLGGGLKADFNITSFFRGDTGAPGRFDADPFFSRDANVGLSGGFGRVSLGRGLAPNFLPTVMTNPFGDSFTVSPLVLHANMNAPGWSANNQTTASNTGWSNQILYSTPSFGGLKANVHYQLGEQSSSGNKGKKNVGLNLMYSGGPLSLTAFYERAQISNPVAPAIVIPTKSNWMLGGSYDFSVVKLYATYGQAKINDQKRENTTYSLGLDVPVSGTAGTVKAAAARTKAEVGGFNAGTRTTFSVGYDHFLSKRTDVYAVAMYDRVSMNIPNKSGTSVIVGVRHRF
ncbi:porin [Comamonas sp. Y33R10-2]|uniref:porin n=1 Tax=Comamonas sp. Y33R10-2 TaxID=2853257 RepID=UPI001C5C8502|nr:porin [Comamonas sp. Y33R10-2]QXZ10243.1 porin [Comamonas sp. Y33R10-2]